MVLHHKDNKLLSICRDLKSLDDFLVLMEDALVHDRISLSLDKSIRVLILVLMEDALVQNVSYVGY